MFGVPAESVTDATAAGTLDTWDSVGHVTLVLELESVYNVSLSAADASAMTDVASVKRVLLARGAEW